MFADFSIVKTKIKKKEAANGTFLERIIIHTLEIHSRMELLPSM